MDNEEKQEIIDGEQLRLLSFFHYVSGAITLAFSSIFLLELVFFIFVFSHPGMFPPDHAGNGQAPLAVMKIFVAVFGVIVSLGVALGVCEIISGVFIKRQRHRIFSLVVAVPRVILIPYGTILSVFTFILLERPTVRQRYAERISKVPRDVA